MESSKIAIKLKPYVCEVELVYKTKVKHSDRIQVKGSEQLHTLLRELYREDSIDLQEVFIVLFLNRAAKVIGYWEASKGSRTGTVIDPALLMKAAIDCGACYIVLTHNHPSGNLQPSRADRELTEKIKLGASYFDIKVMDHIILTSEGYLSFADEGLL